MAPIGISPTVDFAFKLVFGSPDHVGITIHFLNAILGDAVTITGVEFQNPYLGKDYQDDKWIVLDILATDNHGRHLNIEIQTTLPTGILQRLTYYDARLYVDQIQEGEKYERLRPAILICVLTKTLFPGREQLHSDFRMRDAHGFTFTDDLQIHTLELTKLNVARENLLAATAAERWAYFLKYAETMTSTEILAAFRESVFAEAAGVLDMINQSPEQLQEYRARMKFQLDQAARLDYASRKGELLGRISLFQELLGLSKPTKPELLDMELPQLTELENQLQIQFSSRNN